MKDAQYSASASSKGRVHKIGSRSLKLIAELLKLSEYVRHAIGESRLFGRETGFSSKKTPKTGIFERTKNGISSLWEELKAKLLTLGQLLGYPRQIWGIMVQMSYVEGRSTIFSQFFMPIGTHEGTIFFSNTLPLKSHDT